MRRAPPSALVPDLPDGTTVKVIGLGGVGGIVARYLAMFLASLGRELRLVLIDGDAFEDSNSSRMFFKEPGNKARVVREDLLPRFRESSLTLLSIEEYVRPENISLLIQENDVVILAVDNHATRRLVDRHCAEQLRNVCLISGGNDGVGEDSTGRETRGTFGNVQIYIRRDGRDWSPSLCRYHRELEHPHDRLPTDQSCTDVLAQVPQLLFTNLMTAAAILNAFLLYHCGDALHYSELCFDIADGVMNPSPIPAPGSALVAAPTKGKASRGNNQPVRRST